MNVQDDPANANGDGSQSPASHGSSSSSSSSSSGFEAALASAILGSPGDEDGERGAVGGEGGNDTTGTNTNGNGNGTEREGGNGGSSVRGRRGLRSQTPVPGDPLVETVVDRLESLSKISLTSTDTVERREKFLSVVPILEDLASVLETAEEEYLKLPGKSPLFKERSPEMENLAHVGELILGSSALTKCIMTCLSGACEPNLLKVRCAAAHVLLALSSYHSFELDEFIQVATAFVWAYGEGYVNYEEPTRPQSARKRRRTSGRFSFNVGAAMNSRTWLQANPDERRLRASTRAWWKDPKQREDAKRLRHYATGLLAVMGTERKVAIVLMKEYRRQEIYVPFPTVLLKRLNEELFPAWKTDQENKQEFIQALRCAATLGSNQEMLGFLLAESTLSLVDKVLDPTLDKQQVDVQFEAVDLLSRIAVHKRIALQFVDEGGPGRLVALANETKQPAYIHGQLMYCFNALVMASTVLEKLVQRSPELMKGIMTFALDLLSSPQAMSRLNALGFLSGAVGCPQILELFESMGGPRKVLDNIANPIVSLQNAKAPHLLNMATYFLRQYFRVHVAIGAHLVRLRSSDSTKQTGRSRPRSHSIESVSSTSSSHLRPLPRDKLLRVDDKAHSANLGVLEQARNVCIPYLTATKWKPVEELLQYQHLQTQSQQNEEHSSSNGIGLLLAVIEHSNLHGSAHCLESACFALEVLRLVTFLPFTYEFVCCQYVRSAPYSAMLLMQNADTNESEKTGMSIILDAALSPHHPDHKKTIAALEVLCNCCNPAHGIDLAQRRVRVLARRMNAIMMLLSLLRYQQTPKVADQVRYLSCVVLLGLAHDPSIAQVLDHLGVASTLSRIARSDPVLVENKRTHKKLKRAAVELIQLLSGRAEGTKDKEWLAGVINEAADATSKKIQRFSLVARTEVVFDSRELLSLIRDHLQSRGLHQSAAALTSEASLAPSLSFERTQRSAQYKLTQEPDTRLVWPSTKVGMKVKTSFRSTEQVKSENKPAETIDKSWKALRTPSAKQKLLKRSLSTSGSPSRKRRRTHRRGGRPQRLLHSSCNASTPLERIVQDYLREQHRNCTDPVGLVPPFSLYNGNHRCPTSRNKSKEIAPVNFARRLKNRQIISPYGGRKGKMLDTQFIHGRSRALRSYKWSSGINGALDEPCIYTSVQFYNRDSVNTSHSKELLCATEEGDMLCFDVLSGESLCKWDMGSAEIHKIRVTPDGKGIITCAHENRLATLWHVNEDDAYKQPISVLDYLDCDDVEIDSKGSFLLGTYEEAEETNQPSAKLYDLATGKVIRGFSDALPTNHYLYHLSSISPNDQNVCVDGVLWDIRVQNRIHKFDKLSKCGFSKFHPGEEVVMEAFGNWIKQTYIARSQLILNSAVWDIRNFKLFTTCRTFQDSVLRFANEGDVVYSFRPFFNDWPGAKKPRTSAISVTRGSDYRSIYTKHLDRELRAFDLDHFSLHYAVIVEKDIKAHQEPDLRLYEIGLEEPDEYDSDMESLQLDDSDADASSDSLSATVDAWRDGFVMTADEEESSSSESDMSDMI